ncbi:hypothetical protein BH11ACT6_BH11ACT6_01790 [soil metagenome]
MTKTLASLTIAITAALFGASAPAIAAPPLPSCQFEDGNTDGSACDWTDPDTGAIFRVESHNYGDPACKDICLGA